MNWRATFAHNQTARTMLIAVTGYGHEDDRDNALATGFNHHLIKPADTAALLALRAGIIKPLDVCRKLFSALVL